MARVELTLNGRSYGVACEEGQENRLREIAAFADAKMKALAASKPSTSEVQLLVLTTLTLSDQLFDLRSELTKARSAAPAAPQIETELEERYAKLIESLAERVNAVTKKLASA